MVSIYCTVQTGDAISLLLLLSAAVRADEVMMGLQ